MSKRKKINRGLVGVLDRYFHPSAGQVPVLVMDTGFLIDLEEQARDLRAGAPHEVAGEMLAEVGNLAQYVVIPQGIHTEITAHHLNTRKNGKLEIGKEIYSHVQRYAETSRGLVDDLAYDYHYFDSYREEVDKLQAVIEMLHKEVNGGRKGEKKTNGKDPISKNDLDLINTALRFAVKSAFKFRQYKTEKGDEPHAMKGTYRIAVLSPDCHIYKPINTLTTREEGVSYRDYLQAFNTRDYD